MKKSKYIDKAERLIEYYGFSRLISYKNIDKHGNHTIPFPVSRPFIYIDQTEWEYFKELAIETKSYIPFISLLDKYPFDLDLWLHMDEIFDWYCDSEDEFFYFYLENKGSSCRAFYYDPDGNLHEDIKTKITLVRMPGTPLGFAYEGSQAVLAKN